MSSLTNANSRTICESHKNTTFAILFGGIGLHEAIRLESLCIWKEVLVLHEAIQGTMTVVPLSTTKLGPSLLGNSMVSVQSRLDVEEGGKRRIDSAGLAC